MSLNTKHNGKMNILITGGFGYVGSKLCKHLSKNGHNIFIIDNLLQKNFNRKIINRKTKFYKIDVNNYKKLSENFKKINYDIVIHLAAIVGDPASKKYPGLTKKTNFSASKFLFNLCKKNNVKKFIFFSTCSNYGLSKSSKLLNERSPLKPLSIYAKTKVDFEKFLLKDKSKISKIILRISTLYGVSPRMRYDLTINEFTKNLFLKKKLNVFYADTWRPYIHLNDLSKIVIYFLHSKNSFTTKVFNAGVNGENYTKRDICNELIRHLPYSSSLIRYTEISFFDKRNYRVDFSKIKKLGIKSNFNLRKGIKEIIDDLKKNKSRRKFSKLYSNS